MDHRMENASANSTIALPRSEFRSGRFIKLLEKDIGVNFGAVRRAGAGAIRTGRTDVSGTDRPIGPRVCGVYKKVRKSKHWSVGVGAIAAPRPRDHHGDDAAPVAGSRGFVRGIR